MSLRARIQIIKTICWIGVTADALWVVALIYPDFYGFLTGSHLVETGLSLRLVMGIGASLMAGWTVLLAWTAQKPIERRAVMLITALPAITGLCIVTLIGLANGHSENIWILGKCAFLFVAMIVGYYLANTIAKETTCENCH